MVGTAVFTVALFGVSFIKPTLKEITPKDSLLRNIVVSILVLIIALLLVSIAVSLHAKA